MRCYCKKRRIAIYLTKTVLKSTSDAIFNMKKPSKHSSWWRRLEDVFRLHLQKTSSRLLDQDEYVRLSLTSSEDVWVKTNIFVLAIRLQDVFKTSCRNVFKTSSRRLQDVGLNACDFDQKALKLIHSYECDMSQKLKVGFSFSNGILCNLP